MACKVAGIPGLLFHDFRRSTVRNLTRAGVPSVVAQEINVHRTRAIFDRYDIATTSVARAAIRATVEFSQGEGGERCRISYAVATLWAQSTQDRENDLR